MVWGNRLKKRPTVVRGLDFGLPVTPCPQVEGMEGGLYGPGISR